MFKYVNLQQLQDTYQRYGHCNARAEGLPVGACAAGASSSSTGGTGRSPVSNPHNRPLVLGV